jgi:CubicO group peptidase (beta-lactamase class C family)
MADPWGRSVAGAGFSATLRDMARFGRLLANDGRQGGVQLLSTETVARLFAGADPAIYAKEPDFSSWIPGASYRSQWYAFNDHSQAIMAGGIHGQYLFVDKPSGVVIVKQSSLTDAVSQFDADSVRMLRAIAAHLSD